MSTTPRIAFFGTPELATIPLEHMAAAGYMPELVITAPDRPVGRRQTLTPPPVKTWALEHNLPVLQPEAETIGELTTTLAAQPWDCFVVFAYGAILPPDLISLPRCNTLNLHPSLLPALRGASPIRSAILHDHRYTGVSIMEMDDQLDHGPIVAQRAVTIPPDAWPPYGPDLDQQLVTAGSELLVDTLPKWLDGTITPTPQDDTAASYCRKLTRADGELQLDPYNLPTGPEAAHALQVIRGLAGWPGAFFEHNGTRIKITSAELTDAGDLLISRIIPAGKSEMPFSDYFSIPG